MKNPYSILGVSCGSSKEVCKKAYRRMSARYHPDNGGDLEKFHEVQEAWREIESGVVVTKRVRTVLRHKTIFQFQEEE